MSQTVYANPSRKGLWVMSAKLRFIVEFPQESGEFAVNDDIFCESGRCGVRGARCLSWTAEFVVLQSHRGREEQQDCRKALRRGYRLNHLCLGVDWAALWTCSESIPANTWPTQLASPELFCLGYGAIFGTHKHIVANKKLTENCDV